MLYPEACCHGAAAITGVGFLDAGVLPRHVELLEDKCVRTVAARLPGCVTRLPGCVTVLYAGGCAYHFVGCLRSSGHWPCSE